jgi:hypothetical protein
MKAVLDEQIIFDRTSFELEVKSPQRSIIQRLAAGLDGQVGIEMGLRGRKIVQKGQLRAKSQNEFQQQIDVINELIDGNLHILKCPDGRVFKNLLVEDFQTAPSVSGGAHISCRYSITYIQQVY